ncbi:MAG: choice-of-anchor tandem repeat GloVer-containing protein, partial [Gemmataceae bacterium]
MPQPKTNPPQNLWPLAACAAAVLVVIWIATGFDVPHSGAKGKVLALPITPAFVFDGKSGANPVGSLTTDGDNLFGRTSAGGQHGHGVIFRFEPASYRMAWNISFTGDDEKTVGSTPRHDSMYYEPGSGLLFGTTIYVNGKSENTSGGGVLFTVDPHGEGYQTLHTFGRSADGNDWKEDGRHAHSCFIPSSDGNKLYGATASGGRANAGTIYTVSLPGKPAYSAPLFTWPKNEKDAPLGNEPHGRPVVYQAGKNDILLGMTRKGGKHGFGVVYRY